MMGTDCRNRLRAALLAQLPTYDRPADHELAILELGERAARAAS